GTWPRVSPCCLPRRYPSMSTSVPSTGTLSTSAIRRPLPRCGSLWWLASLCSSTCCFAAANVWNTKNACFQLLWRLCFPPAAAGRADGCHCLVHPVLGDALRLAWLDVAAHHVRDQRRALCLAAHTALGKIPR